MTTIVKVWENGKITTKVITTEVKRVYIPQWITGDYSETGCLGNSEALQERSDEITDADVEKGWAY